MERDSGDDPGEIETGDVIQREPAVDDDPGEIEVVDLREGWEEPDREPSRDPGEIELEDIMGERGERGDREIDA